MYSRNTHPAVKIAYIRYLAVRSLVKKSMSIALEERKSDWKYPVLPYDILEKYSLAYRRKL